MCAYLVLAAPLSYAQSSDPTFIYDSQGRLSELLAADGVTVQFKMIYNGNDAAPTAYQVMGGQTRWITADDTLFISTFGALIHPGMTSAEFSALMSTLDGIWEQNNYQATGNSTTPPPAPKSKEQWDAQCDDLYIKMGYGLCGLLAKTNPGFMPPCVVLMTGGYMACKGLSPPPDQGPYEFIWCQDTFNAYSDPQMCGPDPNAMVNKVCASKGSYATNLRWMYDNLYLYAECWWNSPQGPEYSPPPTSSRYWVLCNAQFGADMVALWSIYGLTDSNALAQKYCGIVLPPPHAPVGGHVGLPSPPPNASQ